MKAATIKQLKDELNTRSPKEVMELCLRLGRFKKENKELLTYLLFEAQDEAEFVIHLKEEIDEQFELVNTQSYYYMKKSIRKVLRGIKKHARYSQNKETEVELLLYFCKKLDDFRPSIKRNTVLLGIYMRQVELIRNKLKKLHEDLQFDYQIELEQLKISASN